MSAGRIHLIEGSTFVVSDGAGDLSASPHDPVGLFHRDTRHLSGWQLRLDGAPLTALSGANVAPDEAVFFLVEPTGPEYRDPGVSVLRRRRVRAGMVEWLEVTNHGVEPFAGELSVLFAADFADLFEVRDVPAKAGGRGDRVGEGEVVLGYARGGFRRETIIRAADASVTAAALTFPLALDPGQTWRTRIEVGVAGAGAGFPGGDNRAGAAPGLVRPTATPAEWLAAAPRLTATDDDLVRTYRRSLLDLAALRYYPDCVPGALPAAGLPWYLTLFGRDSLITSYQALPFLPELCRTTLRALAHWQAREFDDFTDAEPGKILHELRQGELTYLRERPHGPYYGSADSTPLFLIVLDEYERWTGDRETIRELEGAARAAVRWLEDYADLGGDGFVWYRSRNPETGLPNQCWKDSPISICHPDGRLAELPHAVCEIQGYAYDARLRAARLARECWGDPVLAERLERDARRLRESFDEAFWLPDQSFYALALDGGKQPVRTLTSNLGHLLWSGIVPAERVDAIVDHLLGDRLFAGWGVRTLAEGQPVYNPMSYHNGSVWPHDNSLIVAGLARYGRRAAAGQLAEAVLAAAPHLAYRLPEVLVGVDRRRAPIPIPYVSACSPQAWAAGTPLLLLRALLGLEPAGDELRVDPDVPASLGQLALAGIPGRWGLRDAG